MKIRIERGLPAALLLLNERATAAGKAISIQLNDTFVFGLFIFSAVLLIMIIYAQVSAFKGILENKNLLEKKGKGNRPNDATKTTAMVFLALFAGHKTMAQTPDGAPLITMTGEMYWLLIGLNAFLLGIVITLHFVQKGVMGSLSGREEEEQGAISRFAAGLTDAVPVEREEEILMDHNYDGIRELDNNLPPWWKYGFYLTIVFAIVYLIHYHVVGSGPLMIEEYNQELAEAKIQMETYMANQANLVDEANLQTLTDEARLEAGKKVYIDNCKICHGQFGEGLVGPNFTDKYWIHGGGIRNIFNTIKVGVPDKGMISWESQLTPGQMHEVASYILALGGTNPSNQKAPQGDLWEEEKAVPDSVSSSADGGKDTALVPDSSVKAGN